MNIEYTCAHCFAPFRQLKTAAYEKAPPLINDLLVCFACRKVSRVTGSGTAVVDLADLDDDARSDLAFAQRILAQNDQRS